MDQSISPAAAVDGSRAVRALSSGADWVIAQALLIGPNGLRKSAVDTILLRGEIERPAVDRCAALLMRSLVDLALKFVESGDGHTLILDGSLYADLPYLLYRLAIRGYEDLPLKVLEQYLDLFDLCQKLGVLLLGVSKSARSAVLGQALLDGNRSLVSSIPPQPDSGTSKPLEADVQEDLEVSRGDSVNGKNQRRGMRSGMNGLPTDGELMHRWTKGAGLTDPVLLGSSSFGRAGAMADEKLTSQIKQALLEPQPSSDLQRVLNRLFNAPAIGTSLLKNSLVELDKRGEMEVQCRRRRSHENDGFKRAGVCPIGLRIPGGTGSPGTFLPASARSPGSLVCLRAGARVLCDGGTTVH